MRFLLTHFFTLFLFNLIVFSTGNANEILTSGNCLNSIFHQKNKTNISQNISIQYITHSTFKITSPLGVVTITDFTGADITGVTGDAKSHSIVILNHTNKNYFNKITNPETKTILQAWSFQKDISQQHLIVKKDVTIRNIQTDIYKDGVLNTPKGNSIFIYKIAGLCIAHLGNIQHALNDEQIKAIGSIDIVMAPVSGRDQFKTEALANLLMVLNAKIIIPMHWKNDADKQDFMADIYPYFSIAGYPTDALNVSTKTLPKTPTIVTMIPQYDQNDTEFTKYH